VDFSQGKSRRKRKATCRFSIDGEEMTLDDIVVSQRLNDLLVLGPQDFNTLIFKALLPLLQARVRVMKNPSDARKEGSLYIIDKQHARPVEKMSSTTKVTLQEDVWDYIVGGMPHFHTAQKYFDGFLVWDNTKHEETHIFRRYEIYHGEVIRHLKDVLKNHRKSLNFQGMGARSRLLTPEMNRSINRIVDTERLLTGWDVDKDIYLALRHGVLTLQPTDKKTVLFTKARVKNLRRAVEKTARYLCRGVERYNEFAEFVYKLRNKNNGTPAEYKSSLEILGAMRAHCLGIPDDLARRFDLAELTTDLDIDNHVRDLREGGLLRNEEMEYLEGNDNPVKLFDRLSHLDYLYMASRVKDLFGVTYVTQTKEQAESLVSRLRRGAFDAYNLHNVVRGVRAEFDSETKRINYVPMDLIEDNYSRDDKLREAGNMRISLYTQPRVWARHTERKYRYEVACTDLAHFADDELGGPGSHLLYEIAQKKIVDGWRRSNPVLYSLYQEIITVLEPIIAIQDELDNPVDKDDCDGDSPVYQARFELPPLHSNPATFR